MATSEPASKKSKKEGSEELPEHLSEALSKVHLSLRTVEALVNAQTSLEQSDVHQKLTAIEKAKYELSAAFTANSLFWMYMKATGQDVKAHGIKHEMQRVQQGLLRLKTVEATLQEHMRVDKSAAKRILRNALWTPKDKEKEIQTKDENVNK